MNTEMTNRRRFLAGMVGTGSGNGGILMTDETYGDFELLLELAPDWGIDSGVFLRTNPRGECFQVHGGTQIWAKQAKCRWRNIRVKNL